MSHPRCRGAARLVALVVLWWLLPAPGLGQISKAPTRRGPLLQVAPLILVGGATEDLLRLAQLSDSARSTAGFLLRSASSMTPRLVGNTSPVHWALVPIDAMLISNSALPLSLNDGAVWAGRGLNARFLAGLRAEWGRVRLVVAPEFVHAGNGTNPDLNAARLPGIPRTRSRYANPWYIIPNSIDLPLRMGDRETSRLDAGQTSLVVAAGRAELGAASENEWWGPGVRNALILSNNAPGFPRLFVRTAAPLATRIGDFEGRWLVGGLSESSFFDDDSSNDLRSISLLALTWRPRWEQRLTLGAARAVFAPAAGWSAVLGDFAQVFADVGTPNALPVSDSTQRPGRDQLFSLFFRWVFPKDGFEAYGEWGRAEQPVSLRDFLVQPDHSQAYTLGLQWVGPEIAPWGRARGRVRVQAEASFLQQSATYRFRPIGTWYTSRAVVQGYTNRGQVLGAAIGPGSSSQYVSLSYEAASWRAGLSVERIRWDEDAHTLQSDPLTANWCTHDVSFLPGSFASVRTPAGTVSVTLSSGWRINTFFTDYFPCEPGQGLDIRNRSLSISFSPFPRL
jgi:hypothetical protein